MSPSHFTDTDFIRSHFALSCCHSKVVLQFFASVTANEPVKIGVLFFLRLVARIPVGKLSGWNATMSVQWNAHNSDRHQSAHRIIWRDFLVPIIENRKLIPFPKSYNRLGRMKLAGLFGSDLCEFCHTLMCKFHVQFYFISVNGWIQVRREPRRALGQIAGESLRMTPMQLPKINLDSDHLHL